MGELTIRSDGIEAKAGMSSRSPRRHAVVRRTAVGGTLLLALLASTASLAQGCRDTFVGNGLNGRDRFSEYLKGTSSLAGSGASTVNALTSVVGTLNSSFLTQSAIVASPPGTVPNQEAGGVFARAIGGTMTSDSVGTATTEFPTRAARTNDPIRDYTLVRSCPTEIDQSYMGFQAGADLARLNLGDSGINMHFGVTAGYTESSVHQRGGTFRGDFQVPYVGLYTAMTRGNFFADAQVRWDFLHSKLTNIGSGLFGQNLDGQGTAFQVNAGYRFDVAPSFFIEPSAGFAYSTLNMDALNLAGTSILSGTINNGRFANRYASPGRFNFTKDIESELGRLSLRFGTNHVVERLALQPFVTLSVIHEFGGAVNSGATSDFTVINPVDTPRRDVFFSRNQIKSTRPDTFYQLGLGIAGQVIDTGILGFARVDLRRGEDVEGLSVTGGLRYQFASGGPVARPAVVSKGAAAPASFVAEAPVNWTGVYVGGHAGMTRGDSDWSPRSFTPYPLTFVEQRVGPSRRFNYRAHENVDFAGGFGGFQVGGNYQLGSFVIGVEGDYGWSNAVGGKGCRSDYFSSCKAGLDSLGTATGRIGYATGRSLFYAKGGAAFGEVTVQKPNNYGGKPSNLEAFNNPFYFAAIAPTVGPYKSTDTAVGWALGGGVEFAISPVVSAKAEYMHYDLGSQRHRLQTTVYEVDMSGDLVRIGLNVKLGSPATGVMAAAPAAIVTK